MSHTHARGHHSRPDGLLHGWSASVATHRPLRVDSHAQIADCLKKLRDEETSVFKNVELLKRRASKNVMLPKRPSDQSKTSPNYVRAAYSTHSSLANNSSTTSFFEICRSIFTARGSTTKLMLDQSSLFFESCQVLCDQNSTFLLILRLPNARLQILIFSLSTILSRRAGYHTAGLP
ncbi:hypothetical protein F2Q70_00030177 [Brassica cretica]|uniref:Uncharacterized protein n=1 Tax=Brassica cretica TaxID=69181 RepID=A0A8S9FLN3_BRACR|nr:hypothetical protein F2Q70_00030177 [Brassica cretica]